MRGRALFDILLVVLASPALTHASAAEAHQSIAGEVSAAIDLFRLDELGKQDFSNTYPLTLADGLTGRWAPLNLAATKGDKPAEKDLIKTCDGHSVRINAGDHFNIRIIEAPDADQEYEVTLASLGGMSFQMQPSVTMLEKANHFDPKEEYHRSSLLSVMKATSGPAVLLRPSPNVFLVQLFGQEPQIYVRCLA